MTQPEGPVFARSAPPDVSAGRRLLDRYLVRYPYLLAVGVMGAGILVRWLLTPLVGGRLPYITLFPAVFAVAWYAGLGPTLVATAFGALAAQVLFFPALAPAPTTGPVELAGTILFILSGIATGIMGEARRRAVLAAAAAALRADEERERAEDEAAKAEEAAAEAEEAAQEAAEALNARMEAEALARRSESEFEEFFHNAVVGLHWVGPDGTILRANRAELEMMGYPEHEYVGRDIAEFHVDQHVIEDILRRLAADERIRDYPARVRCKDGTIKDVLIDSSVYWEDGRFIHTRCFTRDVTAQRRTEDAMRALQRLESVGRLAGGVAHEVNNQMSVVLGAAEFILRRDDVPGAIRADVELMRDAAQRSAGITGQLLAFGRRQLLRPEVLDLARVVRDFEPVLRRTAGSQCELRVTVSADDVRVRADRNQLEQVLLNLAINAVDAMPRGGRLEIRLGLTSVSAGDSRLRLEPDIRPGRYAELVVSDTGIGMDARTLEHVFEPFFTTKPVGEGTGLGLSTAYGIVRQSGGYLEVQSAPGKGSEFTILLPSTSDAVARPERADGLAPVGGRETILLVEDQAEVRMMAARSLRAEGYTVVEASDGQEALDAVSARAGDVALVLTDLAMPRLGGLDLSNELARLAPRLPVLFMTGYTSSEAMRRGALRRGYPLIEKPFTPEELATRVRAALDAVAGVPLSG